MQVLVGYYSRTGNTEALAEAVAGGVREAEGVDCLLKDVSSITREDFVDSQGIILGSPVYFGTMASEMKEMIDRFLPIRKKMEDKIGAAFATSYDPTGGKETTIFSIIQAMLIYGMIVVGDPFSATGHYGIACTGKPDEKTRDHGAKLGRRVAELVKRFW
ncbi:NAD(P)H-dependent oxidoreductase [bacterium]|nr:NAD(P)H-dependent oxidoreductase [bacterium]